jgi:NADPH:quinone reductase-like Zn-dependent oxidoreductase
VLGGYFAGIVETVGEQVTTFSPGQRVFGCTSLSFGAYAEYVVLPARYTIVAMPENMSFTEAAAVPLGGLNALHFLRRAGIASGERVLVNGAGGSIGAHAVQIAKAMGAEVTAVDAAHKRDMLIDIGADRFVDYAREHFADDGRRYDVVLDMVPGKACRDCIAALAPRGRYFSGNPTIAVMLRCLTTSLLTDKRASFAFARESLEELETLKAMVERGEIVSIVDTALPMSRAAEAHRRVEAEQRCGAIVLDLTAAS